MTKPPTKTDGDQADPFAGVDLDTPAQSNVDAAIADLEAVDRECRAVGVPSPSADILRQLRRLGLANRPRRKR